MSPPRFLRRRYTLWALRKKETNPNIEKLSTYFTDPRDGRKYRAVEIGRVTWMAHNLNYETPSGSWCYDDSSYYCDIYGRLYDYKTAKTACPTGWHLPSGKEWDDLVATVGGKVSYMIGSTGIKNRAWFGAGKKLKAKSGWKWDDVEDKSGNGTDDYGFSALPGSLRYFNSEIGANGFWWTSDSGYPSYRRSIYYRADTFYDSDCANDLGHSVRCVQDD